MRCCAKPASTLIVETIVLRRLLRADGRSRAFVNDEPASIGLLRQLGDSLVEIQGQFEQRGLLDPANHRTILDAFAGDMAAAAAMSQAWDKWRAARLRQAEAARLAATGRDEEDLLRHHLAELDALAPEAGEEDRLAARREPVAERRAPGRNLERGDRRTRRRSRRAGGAGAGDTAAGAGTRARSRPARRSLGRGRARRRRDH